MAVGEYLIGLSELNDDNKTITDQLIKDKSNDISFCINNIIDYLNIKASNNGSDDEKDNDKTATTTTTTTTITSDEFDQKYVKDFNNNVDIIRKVLKAVFTFKVKAKFVPIALTKYLKQRLTLLLFLDCQTAMLLSLLNIITNVSQQRKRKIMRKMRIMITIMVMLILL